MDAKLITKQVTNGFTFVTTPVGTEINAPRSLVANGYLLSGNFEPTTANITVWIDGRKHQIPVPPEFVNALHQSVEDNQFPRVKMTMEII